MNEGERLSKLKTRFMRFWPKLGLPLVNPEKHHVGPDDRVLVVGSGRQGSLRGKNVYNSDIAAFPGVDLITDVQRLGFPDEAFDVVIAHQVLEHVADADTALGEIHRILAPGGRAIVSVPFYFPFHASPYDYRRWTIPGLRESCSAFTELEAGIYMGPVSAVLSGFQHLVGLIVPGFYLSYVAQGLVAAILLPFRYLDFLFRRSQRAAQMASAVYFVGAKEPVEGGPSE